MVTFDRLEQEAARARRQHARMADSIATARALTESLRWFGVTGLPLEPLVSSDAVESFVVDDFRKFAELRFSVSWCRINRGQDPRPMHRANVTDVAHVQFVVGGVFSMLPDGTRAPWGARWTGEDCELKWCDRPAREIQWIVSGRLAGRPVTPPPPQRSGLPGSREPRVGTFCLSAGRAILPPEPAAIVRYCLGQVPGPDGLMIEDHGAGGTSEPWADDLYATWSLMASRASSVGKVVR